MYNFIVINKVLGSLLIPVVCLLLLPFLLKIIIRHIGNNKSFLLFEYYSKAKHNLIASRGDPWHTRLPQRLQTSLLLPKRLLQSSAPGFLLQRSRLAAATPNVGAAGSTGGQFYLNRPRRVELTGSYYQAILFDCLHYWIAFTIEFNTFVKTFYLRNCNKFVKNIPSQ